MGGQLYPNHEPDAEPSDDEFSFTDSFPTVFEVGYPGWDPDIQRAEARRLFEELSSTIPFRVALVSGFDILVAVSGQASALSRFPGHDALRARSKGLAALPPAFGVTRRPID